MKYPGGYQIIDLGGLTIPESPAVTLPDPEPWKYAIQQKKPVILTNFRDGVYGLYSPTILQNGNMGAGGKVEYLLGVLINNEGKPSALIKVDVRHIEDGEVDIMIVDVN